MNYRYEGRNAMTQDELMQVLQAGESSMVEFKRCSELPHTDTFETVCSFANRSGGSIYLGVDDDGQVLGVDSKRVSEIERNVVNVVMLLYIVKRLGVLFWVGCRVYPLDGPLLEFGKVACAAFDLADAARGHAERLADLLLGDVPADA